MIAKRRPQYQGKVWLTSVLVSPTNPAVQVPQHFFLCGNACTGSPWLPDCVSCSTTAAGPPSFLSTVASGSHPGARVCPHHARNVTSNGDGEACSTAAIPALPLPATPSNPTTYGSHGCSPSGTVQSLSPPGHCNASRYDHHARSSRPASHAPCRQHAYHGNTPPGTHPLPDATDSPDNASYCRLPTSSSADVPGEARPDLGTPDGQSPRTHGHGPQLGSPARNDGDARDAATTGRTTTIWLSRRGRNHWAAGGHRHTQPILFCECGTASLRSSLCHSHLQREWYLSYKATIILFTAYPGLEDRLLGLCGASVSKQHVMCSL